MVLITEVILVSGTNEVKDHITQLIKLVESIRVYEVKVKTTLHKRVHKDKTYTWKVKRITIPREVNTDKVYIIPEQDYKKLVTTLQKLIQILNENLPNKPDK